MQNNYTGDYYVYTHSIEGRVFYVGSSKLRFYKGNGFKSIHERAFMKKTRRPAWHKIAKDNDVSVNIIEYFKSEEDALQNEYTLISKYVNAGFTLANIKGTTPVFQFTIFGDFVKVWPSIKDASDALNINSHSISCVLNNLNISRQTVGGFLWSNNSICPDYPKHKKLLVQKDLDGNVIRLFMDAQEAVRHLKIRSSTSIRAALSGHQHKAYNSQWERITYAEARETGHLLSKFN